MYRKGIVGLIVMGFLVVGCAEPITKKTKREIHKGINCDTAQRDIQILEKEKATVGKRLVAGVRTVLPVAAVIGVLKGTWNDRAKVATGDYNRAIERKIKEIKASCGL